MLKKPPRGLREAKIDEADRRVRLISGVPASFVGRKWSVGDCYLKNWRCPPALRASVTVYWSLDFVAPAAGKQTTIRRNSNRAGMQPGGQPVLQLDVLVADVLAMDVPDGLQHRENP